MLSLLVCRRKDHPHLDMFLDDQNEAIRNEGVSAIYDTGALDGPAGKKLLSLALEDFPFHQQARLVAAYFRIGTADAAESLLETANTKLKEELRVFAMKFYDGPFLDTDPVRGHYRPTLRTAFSRSDLVSSLVKIFVNL